MLKKRWAKALASTFLLWSIINIYFYSQHRVSVTEIDIPGWEIEVNNNKIMQIKQVRIYDWELKESNPKTRDRWKPVLELGNILPSEELRSMYFRTVSKILHFYSTPYKRLEDSRRIEVSGVIINSEQSNNKWPWIQISLNNETVTKDGSRLSVSGDSNIHLFTEKGIVKNLEQEIASIDLYYHVEFDTDNPDLKTKFLKVSKGDKRNYGFFNPVPSEYYFMDLATTVGEFIKTIKDEKQPTKTMLSDRIVDFPWSKMLWREEQKDELIIYSTARNYLGDYKNFKNVFVVDMAYQFTDEENYKQRLKDDDIDATQAFYVIEEEGQWKIIDVSPLSKSAKGDTSKNYSD